jgi:4-hydroxy-tetrahydrodipicolinate synthase
MLAVANAEPERAKAAFAGNAEAQRALFASHAAARRDFPHGLKGLMAERFGTSRAARLGLRGREDGIRLVRATGWCGGAATHR